MIRTLFLRRSGNTGLGAAPRHYADCFSSALASVGSVTEVEIRESPTLGPLARGLSMLRAMVGGGLASEYRFRLDPSVEEEVAGAEFDVIVVESMLLRRGVGELLRRVRGRKVLVGHDCYSIHHFRAWRSARGSRSRWEALAKHRVQKKIEENFYSMFDRVVVPSPIDARILERRRRVRKAVTLPPFFGEPRIRWQPRCGVAWHVVGDFGDRSCREATLSLDWKRLNGEVLFWGRAANSLVGSLNLGESVSALEFVDEYEDTIVDSRGAIFPQKATSGLLFKVAERVLREVPIAGSRESLAGIRAVLGLPDAFKTVHNSGDLAALSAWPLERDVRSSKELAALAAFRFSSGEFARVLRTAVLDGLV